MWMKMKYFVFKVAALYTVVWLCLSSASSLFLKLVWIFFSGCRDRNLHQTSLSISWDWLICRTRIDHWVNLGEPGKLWEQGVETRKLMPPGHSFSIHGADGFLCTHGREDVCFRSCQFMYLFSFWLQRPKALLQLPIKKKFWKKKKFW